MGRLSFIAVFLWLSLFYWCLSWDDAHAQQVLGFHLSEANGLHTNYNFEIYQDSYGYMWFGGDNGIARYDGESFDYFTVDEGLPGNYTYVIYEDSRGVIWAGGYGGWLARKKGDRFETVISIAETELNSVLDIIENEYGRLLIKGGNGFLYLNPDTKRYTKGELNVSLKGASFSRQKSGTILIFDSNHLYRFHFKEADSISVEQVPIAFSKDMNQSRLPDLSRTTLLEHENGEVYAVVSGVTFGGIWRSDSLIFNSRFYHSAADQAVFNHDSTGIFLGSVRRGLLELDIESGDSQPIFLLPNEEPYRVFNLLADFENNIWVSAFSHGVFKLGENRIIQYNTESGLKSNKVNHISIFDDAYLLTHERELAFINRSDFSHQYSYRNTHENRLTVPVEDGFYIGANYYVSKAKTKASDWESAVTFQHTINTTPSAIINLGDSLLITTIGNEVLKYKDGIITTIQGSMWEPLSIVEQAFATGNEIWFITQSRGVYIFDRDRKEMRKLEGLPTEMVSFAHKNGEKAWLGSRKGIMELEEDSLVKVHGAEDGLLNRKIYHISAAGPSVWVVSDIGIHRYRSGKWIIMQSFSDLFNRPPQINHVRADSVYNRLLLGTNQGIIAFPLDSEVSPKAVPQLIIEALIFNDEERFEEPQRLPADTLESYQRSVQIDYSVLSFTNTNEASYLYRLLPIQTEWKSEPKEKSVLFANLSPNTYRFQVKQVFPGGAQTEVAEASFSITPYFYETIYFRFFMTLFGLCLVGMAVRYGVIRRERIRRRKEESKQFEMIQRVGASIAHDIKNTVFSLSLLAQNLEKRFDNPAFRKDAIETINDSLSHLSRLVSQLKQRPSDWNINRSRGDIVKTVETVVAHLAGEKHAERRVDFQNKLPDAFLFYHDADLIRRIVENLLINAIEVTDSDEQIYVSLTRDEDDGIHIVISDEGPGMSRSFMKHKLFRPFVTTKKQGVGIGMYVTREMIKAHGGELTIESKRGVGTTMDIRFWERTLEQSK